MSVVYDLATYRVASEVSGLVIAAIGTCVCTAIVALMKSMPSKYIVTRSTNSFKCEHMPTRTASFQEVPV